MNESLLFIVNDPVYFISHRLPIALKAKENGYNVHVASAHNKHSDALKDYGFLYHQLPLSRGGTNPIKELWCFFSILLLLWKVKPKILHLVTLKPVVYGGIAARLAPVNSVVAAVAGLGSLFIAEDLKARVICSFIRCFLRTAFAKKKLVVIFQNPTDMDQIISERIVDKNKTCLIKGSGVNLNDYKFIEEPDSRVVVTFAARLILDKGVVEYINAANMLKERDCEAVFNIVGDLDFENRSSISQAELDELTFGSNVEIQGYTSDIAKTFAASNLVVLPSYREGLPKVLIEAAACGRSVVTTDVPGCRDAIIPGVTGLMVPVRDSSALANAMYELITNNGLRKRMGSAGRAFAEQTFSIDSVVDQHLDIYSRF